MPRASRYTPPVPFTEQELLTIQLARQSFRFFLLHVFPDSFRGELFLQSDGTQRPFSLGRIHLLWAQILEVYNRVCILAPRLHLKSTVVHHAYAFWTLFRAETDVSIASISYKQDLAAEHTEIIKRLIIKNSFTRYWHDRKPTSDSIVDFLISFGPDDIPVRGTIDPRGVLGSMRGLHPNVVLADDILSDLRNPLDPKEINHINDIFNQVIGSLPKNNGPIITVGTPQSYEDTLFQLKRNPQYVWGRFPAEQRDPITHKRIPLWPEVFNLSRLATKLLDIKPRAYQIEYLLQPVLAVDTFFPRWAIEALIDPELRPANPFEPYVFSSSIAGMYAGMDIGYEVHPSHISVGAAMKSDDIIQVYQQFLDGMNYNAQAAFINEIAKNFNLRRLYYDATRGELTDRGITPKAIGIKFTKPQKVKMALSLESRVFANPGQPGLILLQDERQTKQIISVDKAMRGIQNADGHGDAFFALALMCRAADDGPVMETIGDFQSSFGQFNKRPNPLVEALSR